MDHTPPLRGREAALLVADDPWSSDATDDAEDDSHRTPSDGGGALPEAPPGPADGLLRPPALRGRDAALAASGGRTTPLPPSAGSHTPAGSSAASGVAPSGSVRHGSGVAAGGRARPSLHGSDRHAPSRGPGPGASAADVDRALSKYRARLHSLPAKDWGGDLHARFAYLAPRFQRLMSLPPPGEEEEEADDGAEEPAEDAFAMGLCQNCQNCLRNLGYTDTMSTLRHHDEDCRLWSAGRVDVGCQHSSPWPGGRDDAAWQETLAPPESSPRYPNHARSPAPVLLEQSVASWPEVHAILQGIDDVRRAAERTPGLLHGAYNPRHGATTTQLRSVLCNMNELERSLRWRCNDMGVAR